MKSHQSTWILWSVAALGIVGMLQAAGCTPPSGGGGGGGGDDADVTDDTGGEQDLEQPIRYNAVVGRTLQIQGGEEAELTFALDVPLDELNLQVESATLNLEETLSLVTLTHAEDNTVPEKPIRLANGECPPSETVAIYYQIGYDEETACQSGRVYGPFDVGLDDDGQPNSVQPATSQVDEDTIEVINAGFFYVCMRVLCPSDAELLIDALAMDVTLAEPEVPEDCPAASNIAGTWTGTYSCSNSCGEGEGGEITLTIIQDGNTAWYQDGSGAAFRGTVCGDSFTFSGGGVGYNETGTFTLTGADTATKTSTYANRDLPETAENEAACGGDCSDVLRRTDGPALCNEDGGRCIDDTNCCEGSQCSCTIAPCTCTFTVE